jgi:molybdenum cofactor cytidylyltransferase
LTGNSTIAVVVLAAGLSSRFGSDKLLHPLAGKPLAAHIADMLAAMPLAHRLAVCPPEPSARADLFRARGFELIPNPEPQRGMASSLALGAQRALDLGADALLVCLADMPNVTGDHLLRLIAAAATSDTAATVFAGTRSPPAIFTRRLFAELAALSGDHGARHLLAQATLIEAPPELAQDFDTPEDFTRT